MTKMEVTFHLGDVVFTQSILSILVDLKLPLTFNKYLYMKYHIHPR